MFFLEHDNFAIDQPILPFVIKIGSNFEFDLSNFEGDDLNNSTPTRIAIQGWYSAWRHVVLSSVKKSGMSS